MKKLKDKLHEYLNGVQLNQFVISLTLQSYAVKQVNHTKCPVEVAEDETAIIQEVRYHQEADILTEFCGINGENHQCLDDFVVKVGNGEDGYRVITNAFE